MKKALIENPNKRIGCDEGHIEVLVTGRMASSASETLVEVKWVTEEEVHTRWMSQHDVFLIQEEA